MMELTQRNKDILSGAIGLLLVLALIVLGVKRSFGAFDGGYELQASFAAAGQGLIDGSDVKIRGVNIGEVDAIALVENRARVTMRIDDGIRIPTDAQAVIRPKTLFGEKFVDILPGVDEFAGPFLDDGAEITDTLGGFELEQVLTDAFPVLASIDPIELAIVVDQLATAADGTGEAVNRSLVNGSTLAELAASNDAEFRQFTDDLALLTEALEQVAPDVARGAGDFAVALGTINDHADDVERLLVDLGRIAGDVADVLEANRGLTEVAMTGGSESLQILYDRRDQVQPVLLGLTQYAETIATSIRIEVGDGTMMAAIKAIVPLAGGANEGTQSPGSSRDPGTDGVSSLVPDLDALLRSSGDALLDLLTGGESR